MDRFLLISALLLVSVVGGHSGATMAYAAPPTEAQIKQCEVKAQERVDRRKRKMREMAGSNTWRGNESIMTKDSALLYLESINHLDLRYPCAVSRAEQESQEVISQLRHLDISKRGAHAEAKKDAAFRYLDQPKGSDPVGSGLNNREVLSLAWAAIQDKTVFHSPQDVEDRTWGLLESLANIQRAHNDCPITGAINWHEGGDRNSCEVGRFKRLVEHLDNLHPDVRLNPAIAEIPVQMIIAAIRQELPRLKAQISSDECHRIKGSFRSSDRGVYQRFLNRLIEEVHASNPSIPLEKIRGQTGAEMMEAVFDTPEWEQCHPSSGQANRDQNHNLLAQANHREAIVHQVARVRNTHPVVVEDPVLGPNSRRFPGGMTWGDKITASGRVVRKSQQDAFEECLNKNPPGERATIRAALEAGRRPTRGFFLPRKADWEEIHLEDFPNLRDDWFWSSSVFARNPANAYGFDSLDGLMGGNVRGSPEAVVCVGAR